MHVTKIHVFSKVGTHSSLISRRKLAMRKKLLFLGQFLENYCFEGHIELGYWGEIREKSVFSRYAIVRIHTP